MHALHNCYSCITIHETITEVLEKGTKSKEKRITY